MPKVGIDYFPFSCSLDEKFELIEAEFGLKGFAVVVKLLQRIYGEHGYYCEWTKDVALSFGQKVGLKQKDGPGNNAAAEIVSASIRRGIFDKALYDKYGILTSVGIQKRYFEAVSRRKSVELISEYLLVDYTHFLKNVDISLKNVDSLRKNASIFKQSREEESKGKESNKHTQYSMSIDSGGRAAETPPSLKEVEDYFFAAFEKQPVYRDVDFILWKVDPYSEAARFCRFNERRGWDRAYEWKKMADMWIEKLFSGGIV